ncbi:PfaB family protein [Candidatus Colwellia aromaticivorans]|uniref:PfaB family protein n=1 Tax=Candidatus Colwellia aromaticivorans TaxID=2267621 RepID=UPI000DF15FC7|nr:PfaB family protein [Candidatus Colwellia aromaticivorans]
MATNNYNGAIIGLDAQFANQSSFQQDIDRVERALYLGKEQGKEQSNSQGNEQANKASSEITLSDCQQAVTRMASANQVNSSDIKLVLVAQNTDFDTSTIDCTISDNAIVVNSLAKALVQIDLLVSQNNLVALVGVNLVAHLSGQSASESELSSSATISFDQNFNGYQACYGIAALLFSSVSFAQSNNSYVYSWLKGFAVGNDVQATTQSALQNAEVKPLDIGLIEVSALADNKLALTESTALIASYGHEEALTTAISCARSVTGEGKGFSQVLGLLRTVIALQQRYIPAISDWQQPQESELDKWQTSNFYLPTESRPWYPHPDSSAHFAAYSCLSSEDALAGNNDYCHVILAENKTTDSSEKHPADDIRHNGFIACSELQLILITGNDQQAILTRLTALETELEFSQSCIHEFALSCFDVYKSKSAEHSYTVSLLCESKEELIKEIQLAKAGIVSALSPDNANNEWRTPKGSYFSATPVNADKNTNNVTFLYPGIGATYVGLGRDLFHLFPEIHQDVANLADDIGASLKDRLLNPRTIIRPDFKALKQLDLNLRGNLADIAEAGVGFACVFTKVFENVFNVKADYATGYSMGEVSMYAALGAWQQPGLMSARLANSDTFNHRLCGELLTLREHWGLDDHADENTDDELIWETYTIKATLDEVITASDGEDRVYCTIINTPDSLLLGGYPEDCLRVIKKLGVRAMPLNMANAIHSAPANKEYDDMVELYTMDVMPRLKTKMYSSSCYLPVPQMSKAIAHSVAKCLCDRVDFPRLINTLHNQGARVFIEMGPGRSLCSWVDKILDFTAKSPVDSASDSESANKARVAVPVNAKGTSDELTYLRAIAKLVSHGVKLDLQTLFNGSIIVKKEL